MGAAGDPGGAALLAFHRDGVERLPGGRGHLALLISSAFPCPGAPRTRCW
jgi:hypothetical protein